MTQVVVDIDRPRRAGRVASLVFWIGLVLGMAVRVGYALSPAMTLNSDISVVYLMSRHVAAGEFSAFYWGQSYGGTALQAVAGAVMAVAGPSVLVLAIVSALFWVGATVVLRAIVTRSIGTVGGVLAGLIFWFPGAEILSTSVLDPGFYGPSLLFGLGTILVAVDRVRRRSWWSWVLLGLLAGLSLWTSPLAIALAAPAVLAAMIADRRITRWLVAAAAGLVSSSPWLLETVASRFSSVKPLGGAGSFHPESVVTLFTSMFPAAFPFGQHLAVGVVYGVLLLGAIVLLVAIGIRRRDLPALLIGSATVALVIVLVAGTGVRLAPDSVRYSGFLMPTVAFAVAFLVTRLAVRARDIVAALVVLVAVAATFITVGADDGLGRADGPPFDRQLVQVGQLLEQRGVHEAYGAYWAAYAVTAATDERVTVAALAPRRFAPYEAAAAGQLPATFVVFTGQTSEAVLLKAPGLAKPEVEHVGGYSVLFFDEWFDPFELKGFGVL